MRIGFAQLEAPTGEFDANLDKLTVALERAAADRVEILSLPECFLTGYPDTEALVRQTAFAVDSPQMMRVLDRTAKFDTTVIVGFNEVRGPDLYNTAIVAHKGHLLGTYSKCFAYQRFHKQGRTFPVFERDGVKFGIVICADGGYIEPARILALKGARVIFSPHFNYINAKGLIQHFAKVRCDHIARAIENGVFFVRANNVVLDKDPAISKYDGVGYGDSYVVDPWGEIVVRSRRGREDFVFCDIDPGACDQAGFTRRSAMSFNELQSFLTAAVTENEANK